ncbi:MAG: hypothetical protein WB952_12470 [Terriglobales bacterium]
MTFFSMATLAISVLWRSSPDYRIAVCVIVSVAAIMLAVRALYAHKFLSGLVFVGVLGVFTPFQSNRHSEVFVSVLEMATLALFAVSPIMIRKSLTPVASSSARGKLAPPIVRQPARMNRS